MSAREAKEELFKQVEQQISLENVCLHKGTRRKKLKAKLLICLETLLPMQLIDMLKRKLLKEQ